MEQTFRNIYYPIFDSGDFILYTLDDDNDNRYAASGVGCANTESEAKRLASLLQYVDTVEPYWIPNNSLLREFIGGSIYDY